MCDENDVGVEAFRSLDCCHLNRKLTQRRFDKGSVGNPQLLVERVVSGFKGANAYGLPPFSAYK